jgi:hypothetical protein
LVDRDVQGLTKNPYCNVWDTIRIQKNEDTILEVNASICHFIAFHAGEWFAQNLLVNLTYGI